MYLKSLEINGFKSFANKTRLEFKPGMMAIVGPNGCGKSNICDAIRWVMGETSAKALRGTKMEDVIFGGTDSKKPLGMAEVSMSFAECEDLLQTEYNEVTVTRRVFRSGENHYFINKTRCRRKDIHKLFLDTGMGTMSYSMLQQGHIDMILSSRPEDRRGIFEEASGINKYKTDKAEAIRKLEQTEVNLIRLDDVIREVKRQIGSLQRQAGKAQRYKTFRDELRACDIFLTQRDLTQSATDLSDVATRLAKGTGELEGIRAEVSTADVAHGELQQAVGETENKIGAAIEASADSRSKLERTEDQIRSNRERIKEYEDLTSRDARDVERAQGALTEQQTLAKQLTEQLSELESRRSAAEKDLEARTQQLTAHEQEMGQLRQERQTHHNKLVEVESKTSLVRNERMQLESREGANTIRRERLAAEQSQLTRLCEDHREREKEIEEELGQLREKIETQKTALVGLREQAAATHAAAEDRKTASHALEANLAAARARHDLLAAEQVDLDSLPGGARALLAEENPLGIDGDLVLNLLAEHLEAHAGYELALEAVLRAWFDAILVTDGPAAVSLMTSLAEQEAGPARLLAADWDRAAPQPPDSTIGKSLLEHVTVSERGQNLAARLLGAVRVVENTSQIPLPAPAGITVVSRDGAVCRHDGTFEIWMRGDSAANPLSRRHAAAEVARTAEALENELRAARSELETLLAQESEGREKVQAAQEQLDEAQIELAMKEGQHKLHVKELAQTGERLETVRYESAQIEAEARVHDEKAAELAKQLKALEAQIQEHKDRSEAISTRLHEMENDRSDLYANVTEHKVQFTEARQRAEHVGHQQRSVAVRISELTEQIDGQSQGLQSYRATVETLTKETAAAEEQIEKLKHTVEDQAAALQSLRTLRAEQGITLGKLEETLSTRRAKADELREHLSTLEVRQKELQMRRQNRLERVTGDYNITEEELLASPEPEWGPEGMPSRDDLETTVAELRTKLEAMGPVNLVAIEEYQELEERYAFLTHQREDLVNAKTQLMEMITQINETSSQLFKETFEKINENFQGIFARFFGGGTAKLVLVNEEDVLDCGIEIIARPPGKRLQNVSLLSGGERTLTAVALLFSIYMIKPSPFCVLDELDAALDDTNIGRFVQIVQDFLSHSQFLIVTHNERTIAAADVLYGVTMARNKGISDIVSMRFTDHETAEENKKEPAPAST